MRLTAADLWQQATEIRREWLEISLRTDPADRATAEQAITSIYARHRRPRPEFLWVLSPWAALPHLAGLPTHETLRSWVSARPPAGRPPIASDIAAGLSRLRSDLAATIDEPRPDRSAPKRRGEPWPVLPPEEALARGIPFLEVLRQNIPAEKQHLRVRERLGPVPVCWYGNQDVSWISYYDTAIRLGLGRARPPFETWMSLARAAGWWWPGEDRCVLVERPGR